MQWIRKEERLEFEYDIRTRPGSPYYRYRWGVTVYPGEEGGYPTGTDGYARSVRSALRQIGRHIARREYGKEFICE